MDLQRRRWWIDPGGGWFVRRCWCFVDEALWVVAERVIEGVLACGVNGIGLTVVDLVRCHQADPGMVMVLILPIEKVATESFGVLDATEALREARLILEGFEVALGERIVVGGMRSVV